MRIYGLPNCGYLHHFRTPKPGILCLFFYFFKINLKALEICKFLSHHNAVHFSVLVPHAKFLISLFLFSQSFATSKQKCDEALW